MKKPLSGLILLLVFEALVIAVLVPGNWTAQVIEREGRLLEERLGKEEHKWVHDKARGWFNASLIDNGLYNATRRHLVPSKQQVADSKGLQNMGNIWFPWVDGRLQAFSNILYHCYSRFALLLTWLPYILIIFIPSIFDGLMTWKIKRNNFEYTSPIIHRYSSHGIIFLAITVVGMFIAPVVLEPLIIPFSIMLVAVLAGLVVGNMQKRI